MVAKLLVDGRGYASGLDALAKLLIHFKHCRKWKAEECRKGCDGTLEQLADAVRCSSSAPGHPCGFVVCCASSSEDAAGR